MGVNWIYSLTSLLSLVKTETFSEDEQHRHQQQPSHHYFVDTPYHPTKYWYIALVPSITPKSIYLETSVLT